MESLQCNKCGADNKLSSRYCSQCGYELPGINAETQVSESNDDVHKLRRNKRLGSIIGVIVFVFVSFAIQQIFFKSPSFDKILVNTASEINKTCPLQVDQYTRLDNTVALPNNTFQYNYTLINTSKSEVNIDTVKKYIEPDIINNVKTSPDLKLFRDNHTTMVYNYRDKNGEFVHKIVITPEMYNEQ